MEQGPRNYRDAEKLEKMKAAVCVTAKTVWLSSSMLGVTLDATDVLICENDVQPVCPFAMED